MSMKLVCAAFHARVGNAGCKLVLIKLADNANDEGTCWPSHQHVADQCEMGVRTVIRHIASLVDMGLISKSPRIKDNRQQSNIYQVHPDKGAKLAPRGVSDEHSGGVTAAVPGVSGWHTESPTPNHKENHRAPAKKAHQMPDEFQLTDTRRQKVIEIAPHLTPENEWGHFVDYHLARGSKFKDWDRAWSTWVRNGVKFNPPKQSEAKRRKEL